MKTYNSQTSILVDLSILTWFRVDDSQSTYALTPKMKFFDSPAPNAELSVITESVGTFTSLDLEGELPKDKAEFFSPDRPVKKNLKSDFSTETKICIVYAKIRN